MLNQSLPFYEAETTIQNVIQDISFSVEPLICRASGAHKAPRSIIGQCLAGCLLRHKAHPSLLYPLCEGQLLNRSINAN